MSRGSVTYRGGATLTEVLMSILIMAVGIVSVFTLFPISVLRTIQATQQTNSKIHKLNALELVRSSPSVLTAFQVNSTVPGSAVPLRYRGQWQPQTAYLNNDVVVPTLKPGQSLPTPLVWYRALQLADTDSSGAFESATNEPVWLPQGSVVDNELQWDPILNAANIPVSYVVDPLGYNIANDDAASPPARFGNKTDPTTGTGVTPGVGTPSESLLRIHGGLATTAAAAANVTLPDSWEESFSGTPASATSTSVTFPPTTDLTGISGSPLRIVLTSTDGRMTVYRSISGIAGQTVNLAQQLPTRFQSPPGSGNFDVGLARIESLTRRYTWFLTVRNDAAGSPDIKCAVVFNRNFASASEHVYNANFGNGLGVDLDNSGGPDGPQHGLTGANWVKIVWPDTEPKPLLKPGNWLLDARDVTWYRVQQVYDEGTAGGVHFAVLLLDRNVRTASLPPPNPTGQAMLMPGIVQIFNFNL